MRKSRFLPVFKIGKKERFSLFFVVFKVGENEVFLPKLGHHLFSSGLRFFSTVDELSFARFRVYCFRVLLWTVVFFLEGSSG